MISNIYIYVYLLLVLYVSYGVEFSNIGNMGLIQHGVLENVVLLEGPNSQGSKLNFTFL